MSLHNKNENNSFMENSHIQEDYIKADYSNIGYYSFSCLAHRKVGSKTFILMQLEIFLVALRDCGHLFS